MSSPSPSAVSDDQIRVERCSSADRAEQAELYAQCFKKPLPQGGLTWRYDRAPMGSSVSVVARPPGGRAISGYACSPRVALVGGDERTLGVVGETGDVMTHPQWRKRGFFSRLDRAAIEHARECGWVLAFGLPNRKSAHIFLQLGWERIGTVRPWTMLLRNDAHARSVRGREGRIARWATPFAARGCVKAMRELARARAGLEVRAVERFDEHVTALSRQVEPRFGFMVRRSADYLNWRFIEAPSRMHLVHTLWRGTELAAYVVGQRPRTPQSTGYLVDVLARDEVSLHAAFSVGLEQLESAGASVVESTAIDGTWWQRVLAGCGFLAPKAENHLTVILHPLLADHPLVAAARDVSRWYFTDGDRDDETVG